MGHLPQELDALLDRLASRLDLEMPPALGSARVGSNEQAWSQGVEAERLRGLALLRQLRDAADGPSPFALAALHFGVRSCLDAAERWRTYSRDEGPSPGRFALLARAEVASRLAGALRELADGPVEDCAAA